jgi:hypothetical protein
MYEHKSQPLAARKIFYRRILNNFLISASIVAISLVIGTLGFHATCANIRWLDAFHNASMLLSGMGPVLNNLCDTGIWFSSCYALFSGVIFITNIGFLLTPVIHRFFHKLHLEDK